MTKVIPDNDKGVFTTAGRGAATIHDQGILYKVDYKDGPEINVSKNSLDTTNLRQVKLIADNKRWD